MAEARRTEGSHLVAAANIGRPTRPRTALRLGPDPERAGHDIEQTQEKGHVRPAHRREMGETGTPHGRLIDLIHPTRVPHHEPGEKARPPSSGLSRSITRSRMALPRARPASRAPTRPGRWRHPRFLDAGGPRSPLHRRRRFPRSIRHHRRTRPHWEEDRRGSGPEPTSTRANGPIPAVLDVAGHHPLRLDASRGHRVEGAVTIGGVDGGDRHDQSGHEPTSRRHPDNGEGRHDGDPSPASPASPSGEDHPRRASNPGSGDRRVGLLDDRISGHGDRVPHRGQLGLTDAWHFRRSSTVSKGPLASLVGNDSLGQHRSDAGKVLQGRRSAG